MEAAPWVKTAKNVLAWVMILLLLLNVVFLLFVKEPSESGLQFLVLDVGQSEALLFSVGGRTVLVDTGSATEREGLVWALSYHGVERIDALILTHPHEDHVGNARYLLTYYEVDTVYLPRANGSDEEWRLIADAAGDRIRYLGTGDELSFGVLDMTVLSSGEAADGEENEEALVLRVSYGKTVLLLMADAGEPTEAFLLATYGKETLDCDFLKVGHHGSATGTTAEFLAATTPVAAAISCGKYNTYGFPHEAVLANLEAVGARVHRTDQSGTLAFSSDGYRIKRISATKGVTPWQK